MFTILLFGCREYVPQSQRVERYDVTVSGERFSAYSATAQWTELADRVQRVIITAEFAGRRKCTIVAYLPVPMQSNDIPLPQNFSTSAPAKGYVVYVHDSLHLESSDKTVSPKMLEFTTLDVQAGWIAGRWHLETSHIILHGEYILPLRRQP